MNKLFNFYNTKVSKSLVSKLLLSATLVISAGHSMNSDKKSTKEFPETSSLQQSMTQTNRMQDVNNTLNSQTAEINSKSAFQPINNVQNNSNNNTGYLLNNEEFINDSHTARINKNSTFKSSQPINKIKNIKNNSNISTINYWQNTNLLELFNNNQLNNQNRVQINTKNFLGNKITRANKNIEINKKNIIINDFNINTKNLLDNENDIQKEILLDEDLDEYNATKNKNIKNKKIFKIVKKNKKYNSKINELGNINGPENINELNNNIDKNNTIFNEINNGKYDNIAKLFTTELLNSLTNKQIEQLKGAIEQIQNENVKYYKIINQILDKIKSNITQEEDEQIKSQINTLKHKDFSKYSKKHYTYYRYKEELVNACKDKYSEIFANIKNMSTVNLNQLAKIFIDAYSEKYFNYYGNVYYIRKANEFHGVPITLSCDDFYRQTLPLANKYYHTIIPTDEEKNMLHYQIVDNILMYYRFLHSETINIPNYELQKKPEVIEFITQWEKEFELLLQNMVEKLHYSKPIIKDENMEKQNNNPLNKYIRRVEIQTRKTINIDGEEIEIETDKKPFVFFKDEKSILADEVPDKNIDNKDDKASNKDDKTSNDEIINNQYNKTSNKIHQFQAPKMKITNISTYKFNDNKQKKIYDTYNDIQQFTRNELFKEQVKQMMLKSENAAIDGDLVNNTYKKEVVIKDNKRIINMRTVNTESNTDMDIDDITKNPKETIQNNNNKK